MEDTSVTELAIRATSSYFNDLIELIPAKYYVKSDYEDFEGSNSRKMKQKNPNKKLLVKKAKLFKLDPTLHKSSSELQLEIEQKENELLKDDSFNNISIKPMNVTCIPSKPLEELRAKLHAKVALLSSDRKVTSEKSKKRRLESKEQDKLAKKRKKDNQSIKRINEIEGKSESLTQKNPVDSKVMFSKFDFAAQINDVRKKKKQKSDKQILAIAEKNRDKLMELESEDAEKASMLKKEIAWKNALKKAEGQKIKDDPKLLKKTLKKKDKQKKKSKLEWNERLKTVENQKLEKQKLRKQHIQERKDGKMAKNKKIKKKSKKPGF
ncbi:surfeit locus protein 6 homolog [Hydra vulgaris]|uniref:surfeit locus protein 6 homolog n=1 Tax=Hydra vulgaris TaxID=6087 RepID=UPI0001923A50|nr:surfeit locus protein 6 homolog [Hydra vulgaris]